MLYVGRWERGDLRNKVGHREARLLRSWQGLTLPGILEGGGLSFLIVAYARAGLFSQVQRYCEKSMVSRKVRAPFPGPARLRGTPPPALAVPCSPLLFGAPSHLCSLLPAGPLAGWGRGVSRRGQVGGCVGRSSRTSSLASRFVPPCAFSPPTPVPAVWLHRKVRHGPCSLQGAAQAGWVPALPAEPAACVDREQVRRWETGPQVGAEGVRPSRVDSSLTSSVVPELLPSALCSSRAPWRGGRDRGATARFPADAHRRLPCSPHHCQPGRQGHLEPPR